MNPIQTDPNPKNDSITDPPEMTPVTRFSHSSQEKKRSDNRRKAARYMQDLHRRNTVGDMLYMVGFWVEYVFVCVGRRVGAVVRGIGDTVLIAETRHLSKDKCWRLVEIIEKAK